MVGRCGDKRVDMPTRLSPHLSRCTGSHSRLVGLELWMSPRHENGL